MLLPEFISFGTIDSLDFLSDLGIAVSQGSDTFRQPAEPKDVYKKEWPNRDGIQYDLSATLYKKARVFRIDGWLLASSFNDFSNKFGNLETLMFSAGNRVIHVNKYDLTVKAKLKSFPAFISPKSVNFRGLQEFGVEISIEFDEINDETSVAVQYVSIRNQDNEEINRVFVPGTYNVIQMSGIADNPDIAYSVSIIDDL